MRHDRVPIDIVRLTGPNAAAALLAPMLAGLDHEEVWILHLDRDLLACHVGMVSGGASVTLPIARVAREAVMLGASAVLIAHNHPGGDAEPSRADRRATVRLADALRPLNIRLLDHLVFGDGRWTSFQRRGWL